MLYASFKDFVAALPPGRLLGIDWGARRIGLAVSDPERKFAFPHSIISPPHITYHISHITSLIKSENIAGIVVGLPLYFDGTESDTTKRIREFAAELASAVPGIPIAFMDETLSSAEATERTKTNIDAAAAAVILEDAIAAMRRTPPKIF